MNTAQLKAEQYVREKCPELMELSFGCEVKLELMHSVYEDQHLGKMVGMYIHESKEGKEEIGYVHWAGFSEPTPERKEKLEIIGHPIQLTHVLRLLIEDWRGEFLEVWDLEKDWNNQEERVFNWLCNEWKI